MAKAPMVPPIERSSHAWGTPGESSSEGRNGARGRIRTTDTRIFNPLLYQLSYPGAPAAVRGTDRLALGSAPMAKRRALGKPLFNPLAGFHPRRAGRAGHSHHPASARGRGRGRTASRRGRVPVCGACGRSGTCGWSGSSCRQRLRESAVQGKAGVFLPADHAPGASGKLAFHGGVDHGAERRGAGKQQHARFCHTFGAA